MHINSSKESASRQGEDSDMFRTFADNIPALAWIANADGYITWYNRRWHEYCGTTPEQMEGWGWQSVHDPDLLPSVLEEWTNSIATGKPFEMTFPLRGADGVYRSFLTRAHPHRAESGEVKNWFGTNTDVSAQIAAEDAVRLARTEAEAAAAEQAAILGQLAEGVIVTDAQGRITFVNAAAERIHGVSRLEVRPDGYSESYRLFTTDGEPYPTQDLPLARAVRGETILSECWRIRRADGTEVLAEGGARPLLDGEGHQVGAVLTIHDDTAREAAERQVRENEARLRALTDNLPGGMVYQVWTSADGTERKFLYVSQSHEKLTGYSAAEVMADPLLPYKLILPEDGPRLAAAEEEALQSGRPFDAQMRFRHRNGEIRWSRAISAPRKQLDGSSIWDGIQIDITDQKLAEDALRESEERLGAALGIAQLGTFEWELSSDQVNLDERSKEIFAFDDKQDVKAQDVFDRIDPEDLARVRAEMDGVRANPSRLETEFRLSLPGGTARTVASISDAVIDPNGHAARMVGVFSDITERKRAEDRQRLLINELNHRVKNMLAIVQALAQQTFQGKASPAEERAAFEARLAALSTAHNLLTSQTWEPVPLAQLIDSTVGAACGGDSHRLKADGPDVTLSPQNAVSVAMALHELCTNAIKYGALSNDLGEVTLTWRIDGDAGKPRLRIEWRERGGPPVSAPSKRGFGSRMIERGLATELGGQVQLTFAPEGLACVIDAPLPQPGARLQA